jgi:hypothetical protein
MRASSVLLALPALSAAQQIPLLDNVVGQVKGWFAQASETASSAIPAASSAAASIPNPIDAATAKVADVQVPALTLANHKELIKPGSATASPGIEEWMVFVTGGNATCFGMCKRPEEAFNGSVALLSATPNPPNLAYLNCEQDGVLCNAWGVSPPRVLHIQLPQPLADQSTPATTVRAISFNRTTVTAPEIAAIHLQETYKQTAPYEGFFHPFNGPLAEYGLNIPVGYAIWGFSKIPSWAFMIGVSFISRNIMYVSCRALADQTNPTLTILQGKTSCPSHCSCRSRRPVNRACQFANDAPERTSSLVGSGRSQGTQNQLLPDPLEDKATHCKPYCNTGFENTLERLFIETSRC